jgi:hypothetical protein
MALTRILLLLISLIILSSCAQDPQGFLRKSANNKYFDMKGFHESKRLPVYNAKYIERAKQNILAANYEKDSENEIDVEEPDEVENPRAYHREIYKQMAIGDNESEKKQFKPKKQGKKKKRSFFSRIAHNDIEEFDNTKIVARSVKIKDPKEIASATHKKNNITDDFEDPLEYAFADDTTSTEQEENIFEDDSKIEKISHNFLEEKNTKTEVKEIVSKELEMQKKQMQKEFEEMKAMLKSTPKEKDQQINVREVVSREIESQKLQMQKEFSEMKAMLKSAPIEKEQKIDVKDVVTAEIRNQKHQLQGDLEEMKIMLKSLEEQVAFAAKSKDIPQENLAPKHNKTAHVEHQIADVIKSHTQSLQEEENFANHQTDSIHTGFLIY